jgi:hypothetical protein
MGEWTTYVTGQATDPGAPMIGEAGGALDALLKHRPQADQEVFETLRKRLGAAIGVKTFEDVRAGLLATVGDDAAGLLLWAGSGDHADAIAKVEEFASPRVAALVRAVVGLYGPELKLAYARYNELPDDWTRINREIYEDLLNDRLLVKVRIDKQNGDQVVIEGVPHSLLELTANMLRTCRMVGRPGAFTQRTIDLLATEYEEFLRLIRSLEGTADTPAAGAAAR